MIETVAPIADPEDDIRDDNDAEAALLERAHKDWTRCSDAWRDNQDNYRADIRFARLDEQWDEGLAKDRKEAGRPVLTINKLPPFIRQVVNDARQNKPSIKVLPQDSEADPKTAEIYSGLIRNIESSSDGDVATDTALDCSASGGFGFFRINLAYVDEASFDQDIVFERVANPLTILPDPDSQAADSADWNIAFVAEMVPKRAFKERYPDSDPVDFEADAFKKPGWVDGDHVLVAEYWRRDVVMKRLILLTNGQTVLEEEYEQAPEGHLTPDGLPAAPEGSSRMVERYEVTCHKLIADRVLETITWPGKWIPIVPVWGEEVVLDGVRHFRSLIRSAKDAQVLYNVNRTAAGEAVARAPLAPWLVEEGAIVDEDKWSSANKKNWAYLEYKKGATQPQRIGMPASPVANLQEALTASDEMKAIIGIYDAGIGARSNETSGRAIMARQRESDTSTFHFIDNLSRAIRHAGRILIDLIPHVYTPGRIIRILGEDGAPEIVRTGTPEEAQQAQAQAALEHAQTMQAVYALGVGRYDLTVAVGPAFNTRREEAATQMIELVRAYPEVAPIIGDLLVKNLDWPGADQIAERIEQARAAQAAQQQPEPEGPDPAKMAKAQTDQYRAQVQAQQGEQKLAIDAFNAETQRAKAVHEITQPTRMRVPVPGDFTGA